MDLQFLLYYDIKLSKILPNIFLGLGATQEKILVCPTKSKKKSDTLFYRKRIVSPTAAQTLLLSIRVSVAN